MATLEMAAGKSRPTSGTLPSACAVHFLRLNRDETWARLRGMEAFPMRKLARRDALTLRHEEAVRRRFDSRSGNLFGLSLDPEQYFGHPDHEGDEQLHRLFIRNEARPLGLVESLLGSSWTSGALASGLLELLEDGDVRSPFRLVPFDGQIYLADAYSSAEDMVYLSNDSLFLARYVAEVLESGIWVSSVVDLGTGSGILACHAARRVGGFALGLDINQRALVFADANAYINRIHANWLNCDYDHAPVPCGSLVIANPPFVFRPPSATLPLHSDGGALGLEMSLKVLDRMNQELSFDSHLVLLTQSPVLESEDRPRLVELIEGRYPGLDVLVENVGTMPPFARYAEFYERAGVTEIEQLVVRAKRGRGALDYRARNRFEGDFCFG